VSKNGEGFPVLSIYKGGDIYYMNYRVNGKRILKEVEKR
jgi:hypothetical protein